MSRELIIKPIAYIHTDFKEKFGIPRQSGCVDSLEATIIFEPAYRNPHSIIGLDDFSHLWLIFDFSECHRENWSPMVRPPRLGGNKKIGVFATRSPYRPNPIGLSCVKIKSIQNTKEFGTVIFVTGADLLDKTPIIDIKPYLPYCDSHPEATGGFTDFIDRTYLDVIYEQDLLDCIPEEKRVTLLNCLKEDPRPSYQNDPDRIYHMAFCDFQVDFSVDANRLTVVNIFKI